MGIGCVLVTSFAVMVCGRRVLLCFFVLPHLVMMTGLEVVVSCSLMMRCSLMMMVRCRVLFLVSHETKSFVGGGGECRKPANAEGRTFAFGMPKIEKLPSTLQTRG